MKAPTSSEELAQAIEVLVKGYVEEAQRVATAALESAFQRSRPGQQGRRPRRRRTSAPREERQRRTQAELESLTEQLYDAVHELAGESMARFSEHLDVPAEQLQRPMARLREAGRVRRVGERHLSRYFPAVGARR
jgi:hypothetical protein